MLNLHSEVFKDLCDAFDVSLADGSAKAWSTALGRTKSYLYDPFLVLESKRDEIEANKDLGYPTLDAWLRDAPRWSHLMLQPDATHPTLHMLLFSTWDYFVNQLTTQLIRKRRQSPKSQIPNEGWILAFVGGLERCVVVKFSFAEHIPSLDVITTIEAPRSALDFDAAIQGVDHAELKNILRSGHKFVAHRGSIIHVDRELDAGVFGPSIDTLIASEVLCQDALEKRNLGFGSALEIGCGNGLLTSQVLIHSPTSRVVSLDIDFAAVRCAYRNLETTPPRPNAYWVCGAFDPNLFSERFDLVICNPPYLPRPPSVTATAAASDYYRAVAGTEVLKQVVGSADRLLNGNGKLLLIVSHLAFDDAVSAIPEGFSYTLPLGKFGHDVLFEVEAVFKRRDWLEYLTSSAGLRRTGTTYSHSIHPMWIQRRS